MEPKPCPLCKKVFCKCFDKDKLINCICKTCGKHLMDCVCPKGIKFEWEDIDNYHKRCKVFGGWLVKCYEDVYENRESIGMNCGWQWRIAMAFVPDPNHEWRIAK